MKLRFLGTGASGGTPGTGRSRRLESSLLVDGRPAVLIDATRHSSTQARWIDNLHRATLATLQRRSRRLGHIEARPVEPGERVTLEGVTARAVLVPHARDCPTFAWRLDHAGVVMVYASDVAALTPELRDACRGAAMLVIDGAMWGRSLFSHLRIDAVLPELCGWPVERIVVTHIGRSAPVHEDLEQHLSRLCPRALAAYDGQVVTIASLAGPDLVT